MNVNLVEIGNYLKWTEVALHCIILMLNIYVLVIIFTTKTINNIEWKFTKISVILDVLYTLSGIVYYSSITAFPDSVWVCQIGGIIKPSLYAICIVSVLILMSIRFCRYVLRIIVKEWVWYFILVFLICMDLTLCIYFAANEKMKPTVLGYCFIDPFEDQVSRLCALFIIVLATIAISIIIINYALLCRLGLQMGSYINSEDLPIDRNSIVEKSIIIVIVKSLSIATAYLILIMPKLIAMAYIVIHLKSLNPLLDVIADFLVGLSSFPNLLTTVLLNSIIRKRFFNFKSS